MDYFTEAFGGFDPQRDADAALKFSLDSLLGDERVDDLVALLSADSRVGGLEGEPGWIIEKREEGQTLGYEDWPSTACFRSFVDPDSYRLAHPEFFCDKSTFERYVCAIADAFAERHPAYTSQISKIKQLLTVR
ncbi:MAG: hypothetical protein WDM91_23780 [Rhizomicrobium sp.]